MRKMTILFVFVVLLLCVAGGKALHPHKAQPMKAAQQNKREIKRTKHKVRK